MEAWSNFFIAEVGATAALAGLVLVGVSINLTRIMAFPTLPGRAAEPMVVLLNVLIISSLMLVPGQSVEAAGLEVLVVAGIACLCVVRIQWRRWQQVEMLRRRTVIGQVLITQAALLPFIVAGLLMLSGSEGGLYWTVPGVALSFVNVFLSAWVLLVEINR
jgi:hypothetical protein